MPQEVKEIQAKATKKKEYTLTFVTHNFHSAGTTDNNVWICFFGESKNTGMVHVKCPDEDPNKIFDKANKQMFKVEADDVGEVIKIRVVHDNKAGIFKWHLNWVLVKTDKQRTRFPVDKWLQPENGGTALKIDLTTGEDCEDALRSINILKASSKDTEAYNVAKRADEIFHSAEYVAKKNESKAYLESHGMLDEHFEERFEEMAIDMAEREGERKQDMIQFERAGLSKEEQKLIPKLSEKNNLCYQYLREHNNNWTYDPKAYDTKYKGRLYRRFDTFDKDSDGVMTIDEVLSWAERMKTLCATNDKEVDVVRNALRTYFTTYGLNESGLHRENWCEAHITMGEATLERQRQGDTVLMETLANAYFDVLDENDDGLISMDELKKMMNVFRVPEEAAYPFFEKADKNKNGALERNEMHNLFMSFWFGDYDASLDGIFAYKY